MDNIEIEDKKSKQRGRPAKGVTADNIHSIVSELMYGGYRYKDSYKYSHEDKKNLAEVTKELDEKGYSDGRSPASIALLINNLKARMSSDDVTDEMEANLKSQIERTQKRELKVQQEDIDRLQDAIDKMGPEFWKRYQATKRQAKHKRSTHKKQIPIEIELFQRLYEGKKGQTWDDYLSDLKHGHDILKIILKGTGASTYGDLLHKLEKSGLAINGYR